MDKLIKWKFPSYLMSRIDKFINKRLLMEKFIYPKLSLDAVLMDRFNLNVGVIQTINRYKIKSDVVLKNCKKNTVYYVNQIRIERSWKIWRVRNTKFCARFEHQRQIDEYRKFMQGCISSFYKNYYYSNTIPV